MIGQLFPDFSSSVNSRECERAVPGGAVVAGFGLSLTFQALLLAVAQPAYTLERTTQRTQVSASPALRMAGSLCDRAGARAGAGPTVTRPQPHPCGRGSVEVCSASKRTPRETNRVRQSRGRKPAVKVVNHAGCWDKSRSPVAQAGLSFGPDPRPFLAPRADESPVARIEAGVTLVVGLHQLRLPPVQDQPDPRHRPRGPLQRIQWMKLIPENQTRLISVAT